MTLCLFFPRPFIILTSQELIELDRADVGFEPLDCIVAVRATTATKEVMLSVSVS
jgi:hypothetical protein